MTSQAHDEQYKLFVAQQEQQQQTQQQQTTHQNAHLLTPPLSSTEEGQVQGQAANDPQGQNQDLQGQPIDQQQHEQQQQQDNNNGNGSDLAALMSSYMNETRTNGPMQ